MGKFQDLSPIAKKRLATALTILLAGPATLMGGLISLILLFVLAVYIADNIPWLANLRLSSASISVSTSIKSIAYLRGPEGSDAGATGRAIRIEFGNGSSTILPLLADWEALSHLSVYRIDMDTAWVVDCVSAYAVNGKTRSVIGLKESDLDMPHEHLGSFLGPSNNMSVSTVEPMPVKKLIMAC